MNEVVYEILLFILNNVAFDGGERQKYVDMLNVAMTGSSPAVTDNPLSAGTFAGGQPALSTAAAGNVPSNPTGAPSGTFDDAAVVASSTKLGVAPPAETVSVDPSAGTVTTTDTETGAATTTVAVTEASPDDPSSAAQSAAADAVLGTVTAPDAVPPVVNDGAVISSSPGTTDKAGTDADMLLEDEDFDVDAALAEVRKAQERLDRARMKQLEQNTGADTSTSTVILPS